jgi:hypothetical protein
VTQEMTSLFRMCDCECHDPDKDVEHPNSCLMIHTRCCNFENKKRDLTAQKELDNLIEKYK